MLALYLGDECIGDGRVEGLEVFDIEATCELNAPSSLTFTLPPTSKWCGQLPLMSKAREIKLEIDGDFVFIGRITKAQQNFDKSIDYEAEGTRAYLNDVVLPDYSTTDEDVPASIDGLFAWYVQHYNNRVTEAHRFTIGINEAYLLDSNNYILRSSSQHPTVWSEIKEKLIDSLGGYVRVRYVGDQRYIDYLASSDHATSQRVEFGENLLDYTREQDMLDYCTRIIPYGATKEDDSNQRVTIEAEADGYLENGFYKMGDSIINEEAERIYGTIEHAEEFSDITLSSNLLKAGLRSLINKQISDSLTISAVDLSRLGVEDPIQVGDFVRVVSKPHGIDEYFICQSRTYHELASEDTFELGSEYETLTGRQSSKLQTLNNSINHLYEKAEELTEEAKAEAREAKKTAEVAQSKADSAETKADEAQETADGAQTSADEAQEKAESATKKAQGAQETADTATEKAEGAQETADSATEKVEQVEEKTTQEISEVKTTLEVLPEMQEGAKIPQYKVIWEDSSDFVLSAELRLTAPLTNFEYIEIFYSDKGIVKSKRVFIENARSGFDISSTMEGGFEFDHQAWLYKQDTNSFSHGHTIRYQIDVEDGNLACTKDETIECNSSTVQPARILGWA